MKCASRARAKNANLEIAKKPLMPTTSAPALAKNTLMYVSPGKFKIFKSAGILSLALVNKHSLARGLEEQSMYGVNFVLLKKNCVFCVMCHIVPICHFSVDLEFSHT